MRYICYHVLCVLITFSLGKCALAQNNIAPLAQVHVSPASNYSKTAGKSKTSFLTNGKQVNAANLWLNPQTLGWQHVSKVSIDFSFSKPYIISGASLHTASRTAAGVNWPLNILVFTSMDGKNYHFAGDMMVQADVSGTAYVARTFKISKLKDIVSQYVRLVIVPNGSFVFTDEIQILGTPARPDQIARNQKDKRVLNKASINAVIATSGKTARNRKFLLLLVDQVQKNGNSKDEKLVAATARKIREADQIDSLQYENFLQQIYKARIESELPSGLLLSGYESPWTSTLNLFQIDKKPTSTLSKKMQGRINGTAFYAFNIFNNTEKSIKTNIDIRGQKGLEIQLFSLKNVRTRNMRIIPDAMMPLSQKQILYLSPGESKIIMVRLEATQSGLFRPEIRFISNNISARVHIVYEGKMLSVDLKKITSPDVDVWAYYNYPFYKSIQKQVNKDLSAHGVNVLVIPPVVTNRMIYSNNDTPLLQYLKVGSQGVDYVFLFTNIRGQLRNNVNYFSTSWKSRFLKGYDEEIKVIEKFGFSRKQIYLYPFDEVKPREIKGYLSFVKWFKAQRPQARIFTTIFDKGVYDKIRGYADIYQILIRNPDLKNIVQDPGESRIWIYDIMDNEKSLSPYSRFRLLPWKAFALGVTGVGFWNYSNMFGTSVWNDFDGKRPDYNVIYDWNGGVIPSRRWAAFKQGLSDYKLLAAYAEKYGMNKAKIMANKVIHSSDKLLKADEILNKILDVLKN